MPGLRYHAAAIHWIRQGNGLPVQRAGEKTDWAQEGSQPPLYYLLAAGLTQWIDTSDWNAVFVPNPFLLHVPGTPHNVNLYRHTRDEAPPYRGTVLAVHLTRWFPLALSLGTLAAGGASSLLFLCALMAAVAAKGTTVLRNAAAEPHVQDLARFLVALGAEIDGDDFIGQIFFGEHDFYPLAIGRRLKVVELDHRGSPFGLMIFLALVILGFFSKEKVAQPLLG